MASAEARQSLIYKLSLNKAVKEVRLLSLREIRFRACPGRQAAPPGKERAPRRDQGGMQFPS